MPEAVDETEPCEKCRHSRGKHKNGTGACTDDIATAWDQHGDPEESEPCECPFFHLYPPKEA